LFREHLARGLSIERFRRGEIPLPLSELHERQRTSTSASVRSVRPFVFGSRWSTVRSSVVPQTEHQGPARFLRKLRTLESEDFWEWAWLHGKGTRDTVTIPCPGSPRERASQRGPVMACKGGAPPSTRPSRRRPVRWFRTGRRRHGVLYFGIPTATGGRACT
jgi:hypothetical protein